MCCVLLFISSYCVIPRPLPVSTCVLLVNQPLCIFKPVFSWLALSVHPVFSSNGSPWYVLVLVFSLICTSLVVVRFFWLLLFSGFQLIIKSLSFVLYPTSWVSSIWVPAFFSSKHNSYSIGGSITAKKLTSSKCLR